MSILLLCLGETLLGSGGVGGEGVLILGGVLLDDLFLVGDFRGLLQTLGGERLAGVAIEVVILSVLPLQGAGVL